MKKWLMAFVMLGGMGTMGTAHASDRLAKSADCNIISSNIKDVNTCTKCFKDGNVFSTSKGCLTPLAAGAKVTDASECIKVPALTDVDACSKCIIKSKGAWVVGQGCKK